MITNKGMWPGLTTQSLFHERFQRSFYHSGGFWYTLVDSLIFKSIKIDVGDPRIVFESVDVVALIEWCENPTDALLAAIWDFNSWWEDDRHLDLLNGMEIRLDKNWREIYWIFTFTSFFMSRSSNGKRPNTIANKTTPIDHTSDSNGLYGRPLRISGLA